jgi:hypothetical protein
MHKKLGIREHSAYVPNEPPYAHSGMACEVGTRRVVTFQFLTLEFSMSFVPPTQSQSVAQIPGYSDNLSRMPEGKVSSLKQFDQEMKQLGNLVYTDVTLNRPGANRTSSNTAAVFVDAQRSDLTNRTGGVDIIYTNKAGKQTGESAQIESYGFPGSLGSKVQITSNGEKLPWVDGTISAKRVGDTYTIGVQTPNGQFKPIDTIIKESQSNNR